MTDMAGTTTRTTPAPRAGDELILAQFYLGCLSQASYLVADPISGRAAVVDPRRDIDEYLAFAAEHGLTIDLVLLTHVHADFVPGYSELAERTGATVAMGEHSPVEFPIRRLRDGERILLGDESGTALEVIATPGHTPESITVAVYAHAPDRQPYAVLTGDTLFLGDVGRPDLLGAAGRTAEQMAAELYRSLHERLLPLSDEVLVYPGHGAGSACGKALSTDTVSTLGAQRRENYALAPMPVDEFIAVVTEGLAEPPSYFSDEVALNRAGHAPIDPHAVLPRVPADAAATDDALLIDVRDVQAFTAAHLIGSVNVGLSGRFAEYAAAVHEPGRPIILIGSTDEVAEARLRLARVGIDTVRAACTDLDVLVSRPELAERSSRLTAPQARERLAGDAHVQVIDVRNPGEVTDGALPHARNLPLPRLRALAADIDPERAVLVYCAGGYRSSAAASYLRALGVRDVSDVIGGYDAWARTD